MKKGKHTEIPEEIDLKRRKAFSRLGLVATAIYAAPVLMTLSQSAHAIDEPIVDAPEAASAPKAPSAPSAPKAPSAPEAPSAPKAPSAPEAPSAPHAPSSPNK